MEVFCYHETSNIPHKISVELSDGCIHVIMSHFFGNHSLDLGLIIWFENGCSNKIL
jgi:hypothetical protein